MRNSPLSKMRMDDSVTRFYEEMYAEGRAGKAPSGLLGQAFVPLRRFELRRIPSAGDHPSYETPHLPGLPPRLYVKLGRLPITGDEEGWDGGHLHYFTFRTVHELLSTHGFGVDHMASTGIFPTVRNVWPTM